MTADELKERLDKLGLDAERVASMLGITAHAVRNWVAGRRKIPPWFVSWLDLYETVNPPRPAPDQGS